MYPANNKYPSFDTIDETYYNQLINQKATKHLKNKNQQQENIQTVAESTEMQIGIASITAGVTCAVVGGLPLAAACVVVGTGALIIDRIQYQAKMEQSNQNFQTKIKDLEKHVANMSQDLLKSNDRNGKLKGQNAKLNNQHISIKQENQSPTAKISRFEGELQKQQQTTQDQVKIINKMAEEKAALKTILDYKTKEVAQLSQENTNQTKLIDIYEKENLQYYIDNEKLTSELQPMTEKNQNVQIRLDESNQCINEQYDKIVVLTKELDIQKKTVQLQEEKSRRLEQDKDLLIESLIKAEEYISILNSQQSIATNPSHNQASLKGAAVARFSKPLPPSGHKLTRSNGRHL